MSDRPAANDRFVRLWLGGGMVALALGLTAVCAGTAACWAGGASFVRYGIESDLEGYRRAVEASDLGASDREAVLARLDHIRDGVRRGEIRVSFLEWVEIDRRIAELVDDGHLPPDELAALHGLLGRIEREGRQYR